MTRMLAFDPSERITPAEALRHDFMKMSKIPHRQTSNILHKRKHGAPGSLARSKLSSGIDNSTFPILQPIPAHFLHTSKQSQLVLPDLAGFRNCCSNFTPFEALRKQSSPDSLGSFALPQHVNYQRPVAKLSTLSDSESSILSYSLRIQPRSQGLVYSTPPKRSLKPAQHENFSQEKVHSTSILSKQQYVWCLCYLYWSNGSKGVCGVPFFADGVREYNPTQHNTQHNTTQHIVSTPR